MAKKQRAEPVEDQLRAFEDESATLPAAPKNLGNFPDDLDRGSQPPVRTEAPDPAPVEEPAAEPAPVAEPPDESPTDRAAEPEPAPDDEVERLRRENEF